jgi:hypothetical protein
MRHPENNMLMKTTLPAACLGVTLQRRPNVMPAKLNVMLFDVVNSVFTKSETFPKVIP